MVQHSRQTLHSLNHKLREEFINTNGSLDKMVWSMEVMISRFENLHPVSAKRSERTYQIS